MYLRGAVSLYRMRISSIKKYKVASGGRGKRYVLVEKASALAKEA